MKKFISRDDAVRRYRIGYQTLLNWDRRGELKRHDPDVVGYPQTNRGAGRRIEVVYDEEELAALARDVVRDKRAVRYNRTEAQAFALLRNGATVVDLVDQLKIDGKTARAIREFFLEETDGIWISADKARKIRALGFPFTRETADKDIERLLDRYYKARNRADKPGPRAVKFVPDEDNDDAPANDDDGDEKK